MRKTAVLISALILINITGYFYSCNPCGKQAGKNIGSTTSCYSIDSSFLTTYGPGDDTVKSNQAVKWSNMRIGLTFSYAVETCYKPKMNPFINNAYACDIVIPIRYTDSVTNISIYSNSDFDAQHTAGMNLSELFTGADIAEFRRVYGGDEYSFILMQAPADTGTHVFTVNLEFSNGVVRSMETVPVHIIK